VNITSYHVNKGAIGVFDSGYGGLTILEKIREELPAYDFIYLGDNARAPYGTRSFEIVYEFTRQAVIALFDMGCRLVILACNTASAKALRTIQQHDLPLIDPTRRVLGVIRPTVECLDPLTHTRHVGVLGTVGTIRSESYPMEIHKLFPDITVAGEACPMWVPLVENGEAEGDGVDYFVEKHIAALLQRDPLIDTLLLGCTHYPLLLPKIERYTPRDIRIVAQGVHVAASLKDYLCRHPEMDERCSKGGNLHFFTSEDETFFAESASRFLRTKITAQRLDFSQE
jgi:glutamate racemase